jgi:uncharacterized NAD(P)/FAD-binding protein YdhS
MATVHSLTINPVKDFFTENEKQVFFDWFIISSKSDWPGISDSEKALINDWSAKNRDKFDDNDLDGLYIPRFIYGIYLSQTMENIIAASKANNVAHIDRICGEAVDVMKISGTDGYVIDIQTSGQTISIMSDILVLGTGSLDSKQINNGLLGNHLCINDIYEPSFDINLKKIANALLLIEPHKRDILIIGSNASASEIVHLLCKSRELDQHTFNKLFILSTSGLPDRLHVNADHDHILEYLKALSETGHFTADELILAIEADVKNAACKGLSVGEIHYSLSDRVVKMQQNLNAEESLKFFKDHGWAFTRITRRTNGDYYFTEKELVKAEKLYFIKGRFVKLCDEQNSTDGLTFIYKATAESIEKQYEQAFPIVIHCGGAEHISDTSSKLLKNLLDKEICRINTANMGLAVDEYFAANDNLYIMGPLLAGVYNSKFKFWHLENAKKLNTLAAIVAGTILSKIESV